MQTHDELAAAYIEELQEARRRALAWWDGLVSGEAARLGDRMAGEASVGVRWPFGPGSHPYVIAVYRKYFLACEALNVSIEERRARPTPAVPAPEAQWGEAAPATGIPAPRDAWALLFDELWGRHNELAEFLQALMVFRPIGTDPLTLQFV